MLFIRNKILGPAVLALLLLGSALACLRAEELPGHLTVIPDPGVIILDGDTLGDSGPVELEIPAGEHLLRFFPLHTADLWAHRYLEYSFTLGAQGRRVIDPRCIHRSSGETSKRARAPKPARDSSSRPRPRTVTS